MEASTLTQSFFTFGMDKFGLLYLRKGGVFQIFWPILMLYSFFFTLVLFVWDFL